MSAKKMFEKLGYKQDNEPRFGSAVSYSCYKDEYWRGDIIFYKNKIINFDEINITLEFLQAINKQIEELGWLNEN